MAGINQSDAGDEDEIRQAEFQTCFKERTSAKRKHTKLIKRVENLIAERATQSDLNKVVPMVNQAFSNLVSAHNRYVTAAELDEDGRREASEYIENRRELQKAFLKAVRPRRQDFEVSVSRNETNRRQDDVTNRDNVTPALDQSIQVGDVRSLANPMTTIVSNGEPQTNLELDQATAAKRRKLDLEFTLHQKKLQQEREKKDLELRQAREQEDIELQISHQNQLLDGFGFAAGSFSSTPAPVAATSTFGNQHPFPPVAANLFEQAEIDVRYGSSQQHRPHHARDPKIAVTKLDGDPRKWPQFASAIKATIADTNFADSIKLLTLKGHLSENIQRRMAHIFTGVHSFLSAFEELKNKYGDPSLIIQAHNQHLLQLSSFKAGDTDALFAMQAAIHEAVTSVGIEHINMFTYSTVVSSLHLKLPVTLQQDWGRYAYNLKRSPSLIDMDCWFDAVVGAEELRGARASGSSSTPKSNQPAYAHKPAHQSQSTGGGYGQRFAPTVLTQSLSRGNEDYHECPACQQNPGHRLETCNIFKRMLVNERAALCATNNHCFKCLVRGHYTRKCTRQGKPCKECNGAHHSWLHGAEQQFPKSSTNAGKNGPSILLVKAPNVSIRPVLLAIVKISIVTKGSALATYAVLDPGSEATLIARSLADSLKLKGPTMSIRFGSFHSSVLIDSNVVSFTVKSLDGSHTSNVTDALVVPKISLSHRKIDWPRVKKNWTHLERLDLPAIDSSKVEVLLGMDLPDVHHILQVASPLNGERGPVAHRNCFSWSVVGKIPQCLVKGPSCKKGVNLGFIQQETDLHEVMTQNQSYDVFSILPAPPANETAENEDEQMVQIIRRSMTRLACGYQIELPLRADCPVIPNNRSQALSRFYGLERRLLEPQMRDFRIKYENKIEKLIESGTVVVVKWSEINKPMESIWYVPHFFVEYPNKPGEIRVVFDCRAEYKGVSLNSFLLRGPPSIPSLVGILIRARQHPVALSADITAFYHRVGVAEKHQPLQRFVYRPFGSKNPPFTCQFTTLMFGEISASSAAVLTLQHAVNQNVEFPHVAAKMKDNFYSDNLCDSFSTEDEAISFANDVRKSLELGGFSLTSFASSSQRVLKEIPIHLRSAQITDLNLDASSKLGVDYILGMEWHTEQDIYKIRVKEMPPVFTKRQMLSAMSLTYDPTGIVLPMMTGAKMLFQQTHRLKSDDGTVCGWDQPLPSEILAKWKSWADGLKMLATIHVKRCFRPADFPLDKTVFSLIVYADSSKVASAALAFLRAQCGDMVRVSFVMARGHLTSLARVTTIPRLELQAAVLGVRLAVFIKKELRLPIASTEFHSDSQIVLYQLRAARPQKVTFVSKRTVEILKHSSPEQWHYIRSQDNPADDATRGIVPKDFGPNCRWLTGPKCLTDPSYTPEQFVPCILAPEETEEAEEAEETEPTEPTVNVNQLHTSASTQKPVLASRVVSRLVAKAKTLTELKRDVAQALRMDPNSKEEITVDELANAYRECLKVAQEEAFPREHKAILNNTPIPRNSVLRRVGPYVDPEDGLMRVDGRLEHAELPARTRHPIIIAPDHPLTRLIVEDAHLKVHHSGVEHTLSIVRQKFYLPQGRRAIRRTLAKCVKCRILHGISRAPIMANLPKERLEAFVRVFTNVGLDCFGPFQVVIGRRSVKRYGLLITCLSTRAVHLEVLDTMDADSFINALIRFFSLRGHPKVIYSDNGTNIVAGERELREGIDNLNSDKVKTSMIDRGIDWRFSPPSAPSFGGVWERLISSSKKAMKAILENRSVNDEVLRTVFAEVAGLLNSRPITNVPTDPSEPEALTPFHFILGSANPHQAPDVEEAFDGLSKKKWKQAQFIVDQFWRRWMREYLPSLIERKKWDKSVRPLRVGDQVLIMDENTRRGEWLQGPITKVFPSSDGVIRKAAVKTARSELIRPVLKLCYISGARE